MEHFTQDIPENARCNLCEKINSRKGRRKDYCLMLLLRNISSFTHPHLHPHLQI